MNLKQALNRARTALRDNNIQDAPLEGEILLRHVLDADRASLFSQLETELNSKQEQALERALERRLRGEPTAYITGHREFYGLDFYVNRHVLIPRPETELLVEQAIALAGRRAIGKIADIGTGSGAIAISLALNIPEATVYATDISAAALKTAGKNCRKHRVTESVILLQGNMLEPLPENVDLIVANLPYVRASELMPGGPLGYEPSVALHGGKKGLDSIIKLCMEAGGKLNNQGCLLLEIGQGQAESVRALLNKEFPGAAIEIYRDLAGIERILSCSLTEI